MARMPWMLHSLGRRPPPLTCTQLLTARCASSRERDAAKEALRSELEVPAWLLDLEDEIFDLEIRAPTSGAAPLRGYCNRKLPAQQRGKPVC